MRTYIILLGLLFSFTSSYSQVFRQTQNDQGVYQEITASDAENSRFLSRQPMNGYVVDINDSIYYYKQFNLDMSENKLYYYQGKNFKPISQKVKEFRFAVRTKEGLDSTFLFQNGFKYNKGDKNGNRFYEVMHNGNVKLLRYFKADEITKDFNTRNRAPEYDVHYEYYLLFKNQVYPLNKTKRDMASFLGTIDVTVEDYFVNNKLDPENPDDLLKMTIELDKSPASR